MLELFGTTCKRAAIAMAALAVLSLVAKPSPAATPDFASAKTTNRGSLVSDNKVRNRMIANGLQVATAMRTGDPLSVYAQFNATMLKRLPRNSFIKVFEDIISENPLGSVLGESIRADGKGNNIYQGEYTWGDDILLVVVGYDQHNKIAGIYYRPQHNLPDDPKAYYLDKNDYRLPFNGLWWVYWGGDTDIQNYHVFSPDQRHAYDIGIAQGGSTHRGQGNNDTDYYCFGNPVLSPANAKVVEVVDGVKDNVPGVINTNAPAGNHVILSCGHGEYLVIAHFKDHSLTVHNGEKVTRGEVIGACGNSGSSSEPHLHIQLQNVPTLFHAISLPLYFEHFYRDGEKTGLGMVQQAQYIHK